MELGHNLSFAQDDHSLVYLDGDGEVTLHLGDWTAEVKRSELHGASVPVLDEGRGTRQH